jgi:antirestriction protein ArdC
VSPLWLTFRQANELGGSVRKGEQSTLIVFWKVDQREDQQEQEPGDEETQRRFLLRYYRVFNLEQCDLPQGVLDKLPQVETHDHDAIAAAELIVANMPQRPELETAGSKAFYSLLSDRVTMPPRELFTTAEEFYGTLLHELTHSTGHKTRLARDTITGAAPFGSPTYSKEELCAEMGAAFLCAEAGISPVVIENQASYIAGWLSKLRDDRKLLVYAAAQAQKAADFILDRQFTGN